MNDTGDCSGSLKGQSVKIDVGWMIPWETGAHGARSAVAGAAAYLTSLGANSVVFTKKHLDEVDAKVYVVLGLNVADAEHVRKTRPGARIVLQNHSPWLFLECASSDWPKWFDCLTWCRKHNQHLGQVALREYDSARRAFGEQGLCFLPAVYPYDVNRKPVSLSDDQPPTLLLAHKDRPWKNLMGQAAAAIMLNQHTPIRLRIFTAEQSETFIVMTDLLRRSGIDYEFAQWEAQGDWRTECAQAAVGMCCTWSECYSQAAMDFMSQGVPILGSPAQWWCPSALQAFPDDLQSMMWTANNAITYDRHTVLRHARNAQAVQKLGLKQWAEGWL